MTGLAYNNPRVQELRRLLGRRSSRYDVGRFVVEGPTLVGEAVRAGWTCVRQFVPASATDAALTGAGEVIELADGVFERVASTTAPRAPIAEVAMPDRSTTRLLDGAGLAVVLHDVSDPGNLGTALRSAEAAGADLVVLTPGSADPYSPKVVRSSAGALFHVPVVTASVSDVGAAGLRLVGTSSHATPARTTVTHRDLDWTGRIAIVMGNEAAGLPSAWTDETGPIDRWVTIEHEGRSESLNVAMATTLLVFEAAHARQT